MSSADLSSTRREGASTRRSDDLARIAGIPRLKVTRDCILNDFDTVCVPVSGLYNYAKISAPKSYHRDMYPFKNNLNCG